MIIFSLFSWSFILIAKYWLHSNPLKAKFEILCNNIYMCILKCWCKYLIPNRYRSVSLPPVVSLIYLKWAKLICAGVPTLSLMKQIVCWTWDSNHRFAKLLIKSEWVNTLIIWYTFLSNICIIECGFDNFGDGLSSWEAESNNKD